LKSLEITVEIERILEVTTPIGEFRYDMEFWSSVGVVAVSALNSTAP